MLVKGEFFRRRYDIPSAVPLLKSAVLKDPAFARASLAAACATLPLMGVTLPGAARGQAPASIERALAVAPSLSAARVSQAMLQLTDLQYVEAEANQLQPEGLDGFRFDATIQRRVT